MLSDSDSDSNGLHTLTVNEHFAKAFEHRKEREELAKLKEKYGSDYSGSGDSDSEDSEDTEEDSDGEELTPAVDAAILRTLALIKKKDPTIYEGERQVFDEEHARTQDKGPTTRSKTRENSKPLTVREAALVSVLAEADSDSSSSSPEPPPLTHTEEQVILRSETRAAFHGAVNSEVEEDDDDLLVPRSQTHDEIEMEEEEYRVFLEREVGEDIRNLVTAETNDVADSNSGDVEIVGEGDEKYGSKKKKKGKREQEEGKEKNSKRPDKMSKKDADREFLMNYIFNRGWIDRSNRRIPTYNEIVESSSKKPANSQANSDSNDGADADKNSDVELGATLSDDNLFEDLVDAFETSYNFRFEEPGGALITSFPRGLPSVRRESTTRKEARARKKERQKEEEQALLEARRQKIRKERAIIEAVVAEEDEGALAIESYSSNNKKSRKQQRKEELARLKALKVKELRRKLEMVSSEGGLDGIDEEALAHLDLDGDWDPSKHDAHMTELYGGDDSIVDDNDAEKPIWDDDIDVDDIIPPTTSKSKAELKRQKKKEKKKNKDADEEFGVDVDEMDADAGWDNRDDDGGVWRGTEEERKRKVDAYMDEVVNRLGFSGITSHIPTRFHYTSTAPENYGLTPAEILLATDAELNSYVGLKKLAPYRVDKEGKVKKNWDPKRAQRLKEFRENLRSRVGSKYEGTWSLENNRAAESQGEKKKRKGKKERAKLRAMQSENDGEKTDDNQPEVTGKSQKRKRKSDISSLPPMSSLTEAEINAEDGARKKRRRRRHNKGSGGGGE